LILFHYFSLTIRKTTRTVKTRFLKLFIGFFTG